METKNEEPVMVNEDLFEEDIEAAEAVKRTVVTSPSSNKKKKIVKIKKNESKDSVFRIGGLLKICSYIIKVVLSYAVMMYLCASFVFTMNIAIELILCMIDALMGTLSDKLECVFVFIPFFILTLFICLKIISKCWKTCILVWHTKYDDYHAHFCGLISLSLGNVLRAMLFLAIFMISHVRVMIETRSIDNLLQMDDLVIFKNLTSASMIIGGIMCVVYIILSFVWKHWISFCCIADLKSLYKFLGLMYRIDLDIWQKMNKKLNRKSAVCDEMNVKFKNHKKNTAIKERYAVEIKHDQKDTNKLSTKQKIYRYFRQKTVGMSIIRTCLKITFALWYITQIIVCSVKHRKMKVSACSVLIPIVFYYILVIDQCKVKLFQYLSGYFATGYGPSLIKVLLTIWFIITVVFGSSQYFMDHMKITERKEQIYGQQMMDIIDEVAKSSLEYPLCKITDERNTILEATFFAKMVYEAPRKEVVSRAIALYNGFSGNEWKMVNECEERFEDNTKFPVFMHLKNAKGHHMIVIRGTAQKQDFYQDFQLYSELISIGALSKLFPISDLWPRSLIKKFVKRMSVTEGIILDTNHYHEQVLEYVNDHIELTQSTKLTIVGHSLGGTVAHIVGAKLKKRFKEAEIRTIGISNPGLVLSSEKFDIDLDILSRISTTIISDLDPVPKIDFSTGQVHNIQCKSSKQRECHSCHRTLFELFESCYGAPNNYQGDGENGAKFKVFMECYQKGKKKVKECLDEAEKKQ